MRGFARFLRRNTIALLALFVALGGTTYAATALPKNSVGARQLKKSAVSNPKIANNAVTGAKVKNNSLTGADVVEAKLAKVPSAKTADTAASAGVATSVAGYTVKRFAATVASGGAQATVLDLNGLLLTLTCPAGAVALRGNNNSGAAAQLRFAGQTGAAASFGGGASNFLSTTNANLNNNVSVGSGSAHLVRTNNTGVTATYAWRNDALGAG
ncbi:MAG TPA: hypothetical protein VH297_08060, partial [Gaiellaceae bacterium]